MGRKNKKEKPIYIDDGSTVADMSSLTGKKSAAGGKETGGVGRKSVPRSAMRDQFRTFTDAQKMMFLPMLAVLGILALAFLIIYFLL